MMQMRTTNDLIRIAAAGGGFRLDCAMRTTNDLIQIAAAASHGNARIIFSGLSMRTTNDLIQIAAAGKGSVSFEE